MNKHDMSDGSKEMFKLHDLKSIFEEMKVIEELKKMDKRNYFDPDWKVFNDSIKKLSKNVSDLIKQYSEDYQEDLSMHLLRKVITNKCITKEQAYLIINELYELGYDFDEWQDNFIDSICVQKSSILTQRQSIVLNNMYRKAMEV